MIIDGVEWDFSKNDTDGYEYLNPAGKLVKFENPKVSTLFLDDAMSFYVIAVCAVDIVLTDIIFL